MGGWKARWAINRMHYLVPPGLYAIGSPSPHDPVLVTANYKMSFDAVRSSVPGRNVWLLVLETFGINVWCAAGKGTFGTDELVTRIHETGLESLVAHRQVLLPVLGAPGVAAHEVARRTGFTVCYATIRAEDIPQFLDNGMVATPAMKELTFSLHERLILIPVELVEGLKSSAVIMAVLALGFGLGGGPAAALTAVTGWLGAVLAGVVLGPLLLPWLPGRSFSIKGWVAGLFWALPFCVLARLQLPLIFAGLLALPAVSAFYTLNFTGCTPFTSRSGVRKEMRLYLPVMGIAIFGGILVVLLSRFI